MAPRSVNCVHPFNQAPSPGCVYMQWKKRRQQTGKGEMSKGEKNNSGTPLFQDRHANNLNKLIKGTKCRYVSLKNVMQNNRQTH